MKTARCTPKIEREETGPFDIRFQNDEVRSAVLRAMRTAAERSFDVSAEGLIDEIPSITEDLSYHLRTRVKAIVNHLITYRRR